MDTGEPFDAEYYQYLLTSLTLNSRALITDLTTAAERHPDHAEEIVNLIDERIKKCLPQHKLFSIYLLDSICKNIGNPYNLIFGSRLYKIFTESYLLVTDTPTRQDLINLFKTWAGARTSSGLELFPRDVIARIEQFIIKATSIGQQQAPIPPTRSQNLDSLGTQRVSTPQQQSTPVHPPDVLLREANLLLQIIIGLTAEIDKVELDPNSSNDTQIISMDLGRNNMISRINHISDSILSGSKASYEVNSDPFYQDLMRFRRQLEDERKIQEQLLQQVKNVPSSDTLSHKKLQQSSPNVKIDPVPNTKFFSNWTLEITEDKELLNSVENWGKHIKESQENASLIHLQLDELEREQHDKSQQKLLQQESPKPPAPIGVPQSSGSFLFDSLVSNSTTDSNDSRESADDNNETDVDMNQADSAPIHIPKRPESLPPSNLKKRSFLFGEPKPTKRVRFSDDINWQFIENIE
ncbi:hypothetical protein CAAN1_09S03862 [[Candida] anglica]|uniref:CID domain-containing protein n=1 Tax=[Candida] anglica TaxID=148631 RepID=A0ABP0EFI9_9ASCO